MNVILAVAGICMLAVGLSCPSETTTVTPPPRGDAELVLFFTGQELGSLRPCGCSGGQLGGLEKRPAVFDTVPASSRLIVETGGLVRNDREQDLIKFRILFEAMGLLDYDVVHLSDDDLAIAAQLGLLADPAVRLAIIGPPDSDRPAVFTRRFTPKGRDIVVSVASLDPQATPVETAGTFFEDAAGASCVNILILRHYDAAFLGALAVRAPAVDCVICPSDSDEPRLLSRPAARPVVFTVGRYGRHICRLDVATGGQGGQPVLRFEAIPVVEGLPDAPALVELYRQYQQLVKESRLLEKYPRIPLPKDLAFVGSKTCNRCHEYEYDRWSTKAHADAFATLKAVGSDYDPECAVCHVVGMEYEGGFITEDETPHLKDVGCENCHGPGSEHVRAVGQAATPQPQMTCLQCHTPEKSTGFAGHEEEYMKKIVHWREPTAAGSVKNQ